MGIIFLDREEYDFCDVIEEVCWIVFISRFFVIIIGNCVVFYVVEFLCIDFKYCCVFYVF